MYKQQLSAVIGVSLLYICVQPLISVIKASSWPTMHDSKLHQPSGGTINASAYWKNILQQ